MSSLLALPRAGQYGCILADFPWSFRSWSGKRGTAHRTANDHYSTVGKDGLQSLPIAQIAARDCAFFLWAVDSHLDEAIDLGRGYGFRFATVAFVWAKTGVTVPYAMGMGYWTRKQAEVCLLFVRGKPSRLDKGVRQIIAAPRREHSRKPDEQYERIERLVAGPYVELFARQTRSGWDAWGNEVTKFDAGNVSAGRERSDRVGEPIPSDQP